MNRVLVTGATGFIGSIMVDSLLEKGLDVFALDRLIAVNVSRTVWRRRLERFHEIYAAHNATVPLEIVDLAVERDRLHKILVNNKIDTVFMLAAVFGGREFVDKRQADCSIGFAIDQNTIRACYESGCVERIAY